MQACTHPPKILLLRISMFREAEGGSTRKLHTRVAIPCQVHIPCYREVGSACDLVMYTIVACAFCVVEPHPWPLHNEIHKSPSTQAAPHAPPNGRQMTASQ